MFKIIHFTNIQLYTYIAYDLKLYELKMLRNTSINEQICFEYCP